MPTLAGLAAIDSRCAVDFHDYYSLLQYDAQLQPAVLRLTLRPLPRRAAQNG